MSDSIWVEMIKEVDLNGDGQIEFEEFEKLMQIFLERQTSSEAERDEDVFWQ